MKNAVLASAIAGLISGLLSTIIVLIGRLMKLFGVLAPLENAFMFSVGWIVLTVIFCIFFGLLYKRIYDLIPGKGIMKGLFFGLLIWFIKDIAAGAYLIFSGTVVAEGLLEWIAAGVNLIVMGSYMWVIYGLVLGTLYKK
ncbi:MAG: hypothetical protein NWF08_06395 [Candidatus Bathyarchaeota archaeon]|nr:hypothetical protein [Candidatus Bathyarchaeota archaeon]